MHFQTPSSSSHHGALDISLVSLRADWMWPGLGHLLFYICWIIFFLPPAALDYHIRLYQCFKVKVWAGDTVWITVNRRHYQFLFSSCLQDDSQKCDEWNKCNGNFNFVNNIPGCSNVKWECDFVVALSTLLLHHRATMLELNYTKLKWRWLSQFLVRKEGSQRDFTNLYHVLEAEAEQMWLLSDFNAVHLQPNIVQ